MREGSMSEKNTWHNIITKCWEDEAFKNRLLADPSSTLRAEGLEIPEGLTVSVVANTAQVHTLVIPEKPTQLSDSDLPLGTARLQVGGNGCVKIISCW
jgi:hypothetical protein